MDSTMTNSTVVFRSATSLTDFLHTLSIAAPLFLILLGSYVVYENLIVNMALRVAVLVAFLGAVALLAPMGNRLKHVEITRHGCTVLSSHGHSHEISFCDIEGCVVQRPLGIVKLKVRATTKLPGDSVWFIPETPAQKSKKESLEEVQTFFGRFIVQSTRERSLSHP
jgi:hypothetical protein